MRLVVYHYVNAHKVPTNLSSPAGSHIKYAALMVADGTDGGCEECYTGDTYDASKTHNGDTTATSGGDGGDGGPTKAGLLAKFAAKVGAATTAALTSEDAAVWTASAQYAPPPSKPK